jgi:hypothetical protein
VRMGWGREDTVQRCKRAKVERGEGYGAENFAGLGR